MRRLLHLSVMAATAAALLIGGAMPVAAASNTVYIGTKATANFTKVSPVVVSITVPAGVWWATATATVDGSAGSSPGDGTTICILSRDSDPRDQVSWTLNAGSTGDAIESLYLTAIVPTGDTWSLELHCSTTSNATLTLKDIRLSAVKGSSDGSQKPIFSSATNDGGVITGDGAYHQVGGVPVTKGKWWIVGKTGLQSSSLDPGAVTCRIRISDADQDETSETLEASSAGSTGEIAVQTAHSFTSSGFAVFECKSSQTFITSNVQSIAIKGGTLVRKPVGGSTSAAGSKTPKIYTAYKYDSVAVPNGATLTNVATLKLPAGKWLVQAKAQLTDATNVPVQCRVTVKNATTDVLSYGSMGSGLTGLYLQAAGQSSSSMTAKLQCAAQGSASLSFLRLTAISASSINTTALSSN